MAGFLGRFVFKACVRNARDVERIAAGLDEIREKAADCPWLELDRAVKKIEDGLRGLTIEESK
jgi:hypothetical protein